MSLSAQVRLAVGGLDLDAGVEAAAGEPVVLVGPNGAGKTTLLRALAGLVPLSGGRVVLDGEVVDDPEASRWTPPEQRSIGCVFQNYLLFPHLDALDNVAFGPRCRGAPKAQARAHARSWLERLGLSEVAGERPGSLSGGQAQRVALARALAIDPRLLLLDEPLAALDASARGEVRADLRRHLSTFDGACLLVTHDPIEALVLGRHLVVLEGGRVTQQGPASEVADAPRSPWVAELVGVNLLRGQGRGDGVELAGGGWLAAAGAGTGEVFAVIHPRSVALHRRPPEGTPGNVWRGRAGAVELLGDRVRVRVLLEHRPPLAAEVTPAAVAELGLDTGGEVWVSVKATEVDLHRA